MAFRLANWSSETCNTVGSGDLILTGAENASQGRFRDGLSSGEVFYSILDGANREAGIGIFNGVDRITRNNVDTTLSNGVYKSSNPAPISLTGASVVSGTYNARTYQESINDIAQLRTDVNTNITNIANNTAAIETLESGESGLTPRVTQNEIDIAANTEAIELLDGGNSILEPRVAQNEADIATNISGIAANTTNVGTNTGNITTNTTNISTNTGNIGTNTTNISTNTSALATLDADVSFRESAVTALETGGAITQSGASTITVASGSGEIIDSYTDPRNQIVEDVVWSEQVVEMIANAGMPAAIGFGITEVGIDDTGTVVFFPNGMSSAQRKVNIRLGFIEYIDQVIDDISNSPMVSNQTGNILMDYIDFLDTGDKLKDLAITATTLGDLTFWRTQGELFSPGINYPIARANQNIAVILASGSEIVAVAFTPILYNNGTTITQADTTLIDSAQFESTGEGSLSNIGNGKAVIHYIFQSLGGHFFMSYAQTEYDDYTIATGNLEADKALHKFPVETSNLIFLGQAVVLKGSTSWDGITAGLYPSGGGSSGGGAGAGSVIAVDVGYTDTYTLGANVQAALDTLGSVKLTADQNDAVDGAATPSSSNVFATMADLGGAGTSHNDLTDVQGGIALEHYHLSSAELSKLTTIPADANNYVHPSHSGADTSEATGALSGAVVVSQVDLTVTTDTLGHVTANTATVGTRTLTLADLGYTGDTDATNAQTKAEIDALGINATEVTGIAGADIYAETKSIDNSYYRQIADATLGTGTHVFNFANGDMQKLTATGGIAINFSGFPIGSVSTMIVDAVNWGNFTITYPAGTLFAGGLAPSYSSSGTDRLMIIKDANEVFSIFVIGLNIATVV